MGTALGDECVNNHWIPDGAKDHPADRHGPRERLVASLDAVLDPALRIGPACVDAVEGKLFGLGVEDYTAGSNDFYANYALSRGAVLCLDMGHFHPTESIADKISAHLPFHEKLLIHTSRPIRWDSDHVVLFGDDVRNVFLEIVRCVALDRVYVALDFFDASINRIGAYVIGARATRKSHPLRAAGSYGKSEGTRTGRQTGAETRPDGRHENNALRRSLGHGLPEIRRPPRRRVDSRNGSLRRTGFVTAGIKKIAERCGY